MQFTTLAVAALLGVSQAAQVHVVNVGKDPATNKTGQKFWPDNIKANVGDMVQFQFWAGNHTATQSSFDAACIPMSRSNPSGPAGVFSGFQPAANAEAEKKIPVFTMEIKDSTPKWFYCGQGKHCQNGMVMVINENAVANSTRTLNNYKQAATRAQTGPQDGTVTGGEASTQSPGAGTSGAKSNLVAVPATLMLALGATFMLM
ncbi:hypothetical protein HIM_00110 [Hirsutella minnesotensis 3608]|nr:hypothetical protein HIM_00110 [Hirsutella minnesotensis 3608]